MNFTRRLFSQLTNSPLANFSYLLLESQQNQACLRFPALSISSVQVYLADSIWGLLPCRPLPLTPHFVSCSSLVLVRLEAQATAKWSHFLHHLIHLKLGCVSFEAKLCHLRRPLPCRVAPKLTKYPGFNRHKDCYCPLPRHSFDLPPNPCQSYQEVLVFVQ